MKSATCLSCATLLLLVACGAPQPARRADPGPADQARELQDAGESEQAARLWLELAADDPARANHYRLRAAEAWLAAGDDEGARALLDGLDATTLDTAERWHLELLRAELAVLQGDVLQARWFLDGLPEDLPRALAQRRAALAERLDEAAASPAAQAMASLERAIESAQFEPELALALLIDLTRDELATLYRARRQDPRMAPWLDLALSARQHLLDDQRLWPALEAWAARHPATGYPPDEAGSWLSAWRETVTLPSTVAILLPGDGALQTPGRALRDGLVARWLELPASQRPELMFIDLRSEPDAVVGAWFQAREGGADFLIGPLDRPQVDTLLAVPDRTLPALLLNQPTDDTVHAGGLHFILALPPEEDAELAAVHALATDRRRAVVLEQDSAWGRRVADAFSAHFELGGGRVLRRVRFQSGDSDHSNLITDLLDLESSQARARRLQSVLGQAVEFEPVRRTDMDFIFLAGRGSDARLLKPQLKYFGADDIPVLATSHSYDGRPDAQRDRDLDGLELPLAPWLITGTALGDQGERARRQFSDLNNPTLALLHALGRDAMSLLPWLDRMRADPALYLPGATGSLRLDADGRIERDLPWVKFRGGLPVPEA